MITATGNSRSKREGRWRRAALRALRTALFAAGPLALALAAMWATPAPAEAHARAGGIRPRVIVVAPSHAHPVRAAVVHRHRQLDRLHRHAHRLHRAHHHRGHRSVLRAGVVVRLR